MYAYVRTKISRKDRLPDFLTRGAPLARFARGSFATTSLATTDFVLGAFISCPLSLQALLQSKWPFSNTTCQYQGYIADTQSVASIQTLAAFRSDYEYETEYEYDF